MSAAQPTAAGLLAVARAAAAAGAAVLAERWHGAHPARQLTPEALGAETKSSGSDWVTEFDRRAEDAVRRVLASYRPHDEISGEQHGVTTPTDPSGLRWSIDPLDGTTNFIRGVPQFCTSVAVCGPALDAADQTAGTRGDGEPVWLAGAVVAPALHRTWYAAQGEGSYCVLDADPVRLGVGPGHAAPDAAQPVRLTGPVPSRSGRLLATGFGYDPRRRARQLRDLGRLMEGFGDVRRIGSAALDLCMVADGTLDAYAELGTQEHDWAAGALIAEEAGVVVHRPRHPDGGARPDWALAGTLESGLVESLRAEYTDEKESR